MSENEIYDLLEKLLNIKQVSEIKEEIKKAMREEIAEKMPPHMRLLVMKIKNIEDFDDHTSVFLSMQIDDLTMKYLRLLIEKADYTYLQKDINGITISFYKQAGNKGLEIAKFSILENTEMSIKINGVDILHTDRIRVLHSLMQIAQWLDTKIYML